MATVYRVHFEGDGDGYEDFRHQASAEDACCQWEAAYGEGEAWITEETVSEDVAARLLD